MTTMRTVLPRKSAATTAALKALVRKPSKYRNHKITVDGVTFDSKLEYARWCELKLLERAGEITDLRRQVKIPLCGSGFTVVAHYIADAAYKTKAGVPVTEDTKSEATAKLPLFRLKFKLFRDNYGYDISIVGRKNGR